MDKNQATELRDKILEDIKPLMINDVPDGSEKFELLMRIIQTGKADVDLFNKAYENAKLIDDQEERLNALLSILDEIDISAGDTKNIAPEVIQREDAPTPEVINQTYQEDNFGQ